MTTVGIDLGTTISAIARVDEAGVPRLAQLRDQSPRLRSVVAVEPDGTIVVGEAAQALLPLDASSGFAFFKREMGTSWSAELAGRTWTAPALSAEVLGALVADAAAAWGFTPRRAVVTVPAYFGDDARRATYEAGRLAGLEIVELLQEPTAACLAYAPDPDVRSTQLVYDLGGGTFDVSVVRFDPAGAQVLATDGDHHLGGKDWDDVLVDLVADQVERDTGVDLRDDMDAVTDLLERVRQAKHTLSARPSTKVRVVTPQGMREAVVERSAFEARAAHLFERTGALVRRVLDDIGGAQHLDDVLLVGGSSRMPRCREVLMECTGREPRLGVDPDAAVALGAALMAARLDAPAVPSGGGALSRVRRVSDVTAHALGFVVVSGDGSRYVNEVMIERNAPIPATSSKTHTLSIPRGETGTLDVYMLQGGAERPLDTSPLGRWTFDDVPGARSDVPVNVTYEYDADAVVHVSAAVGGRVLAAPRIDREDRDLSWTDEDPASHLVPDLAVALTIDVSGSMGGGKLEEAKQACLAFVDDLEEAGLGERIAVVSFGSSGHVHARAGSTVAEVRAAVRHMNISGSTNMGDGIDVAWSALGDVGTRRVIVLLTDGAPDSEQYALASRARVVAGDGEIIARGVRGANESFLRQLDSGSELFPDGGVVAGFRGIAKQLTGGANLDGNLGGRRPGGPGGLRARR